MGGADIDFEQAIHAAQERLLDRSFEWLWLDLDAPEVVIQGLSGEGGPSCCWCSTHFLTVPLPSKKSSLSAQRR